jgi:hypothetical protein
MDIEIGKPFHNISQEEWKYNAQRVSSVLNLGLYKVTGLLVKIQDC